MIRLLDQATVNKIAAGEVIERPAAVVKELTENAIDAGATAITIEIKEGGLSFIRITDNGGGIAKDEIKLAFERHSTSKIKSAEDLLHVKSLGFRGEALSSIAAVAQVELVTKVPGEMIGCRYVTEGGVEKNIEEIGCPDGTTFVVRNLFYNTPARRKFLKSAMTEAGYINDIVERLAVSHAGLSFKFIHNNQLKLGTSGNGNLKDIIYHIYGRDIAAGLLETDREQQGISIKGYIGKPVVSRGNRNFMNYFINGRYIKSKLINKALEDAYKPYSMQHRYPFTSLSFEVDPELIDVNVHPSKMELRFTSQETVYNFTKQAVEDTLRGKELIEEALVSAEKPMPIKTSVLKILPPEPFEIHRIERQSVTKAQDRRPPEFEPVIVKESPEQYHAVEQMTLFDDRLLSKKSASSHRIIGQLFRTYWIVEFESNMYMIDQHAAHEKVLYEKLMASLQNKEFSSQLLEPPIILSLSMREEQIVKEHISVLNTLGFEIEPFGGREYSVRGIPGDLLGIAQKELLIELIDSLTDEGPGGSAQMILEKAASMSCKAAIKANHAMSQEEARAMIGSLLELENPYHCPHGRPVIISMSKYEIEKKFKRVL